MKCKFICILTSYIHSIYIYTHIYVDKIEGASSISSYRWAGMMRKALSSHIFMWVVLMMLVLHASARNLQTQPSLKDFAITQAHISSSSPLKEVATRRRSGGPGQPGSNVGIYPGRPSFCRPFCS